jgi:aminopeptidase YwaD
MSIYDRCRYFADDIGWRWIGSEGERLAGDWVEKFWHKLGLSVERKFTACPAWDYELTKLNVAGETFTADAQMFSAGCDLTGELVALVPNPDCSIPVSASGKIVIIKEQDTENYGNFENALFFRIALLEALKNAGVLAVVIISVLPETYATKMFRTPGSGLACAAVSATTGKQLLKRVGQQATLKIVASERPGETAYIATEIGPKDAPLCLAVAHYDGAPISKAAVDNASGLAVMLTLSEYFVKNPPKNSRIRFIAFGGHEYGSMDMCGYTSKYYAEQHQDEMEQIKYLIHLDILGIKGTTPQVKIHGSEKLFKNIRLALASDKELKLSEYGGFIGADFGVFMRQGVPCIMMESSKSEYNTTAYHSPLDDMRWIGTNGELDAAFEVAKKILINV